MEQTRANTEAVDQSRRTEDMASVLRVVRGLTHKHSFERNHLPPAKRDRSLTIKDMDGKIGIWKELHSILLPSIHDQLELLRNSLDLLHPMKKPKPDIKPILEILSNLDKTLESTVSAIVCLTLESPLPDEKHDHGLQAAKFFRCAYLHKKIQSLVERLIYELLFRHQLASFVGWCIRPTVTIHNDSLRTPGPGLRHQIGTIILYCNNEITKTIHWCRTSDWAVIQDAWSEVCTPLDLVVEKFTGQANRRIPPAYRTNTNIETNATTEFIVKVARSALPLVKLARILGKKTSGMISTKRISTSDATLELNSETIKQLYEAPQALARLYHLYNLLSLLDLSVRVIPVNQQIGIRSLIQNLPRGMASTLSVLDSVLIPVLAQVKDNSPTTQFNSFLPDLKQSWDKASEHLIDVMITSFEFEHMNV
ncbi:hypothetical protein PTTG_29318 [Puccinia triticina 1-1 BBBD Race 1]|uniref:Uncharacterized protein n=2 Tax=Puccinia triticina TaxID=208348 RepID=A0A180G736_PUCT1|nr:uncharacterized protein PtA15_12A166 [Puccinia triticina]XP_053025737.1 uncharacterized protein PtA15_12A168 [Puccinia triticina]OAV87703.1 hypothetical protein PTTG_29318 [Puccinia triticina 1-1 BBBD Race 1]WAQ90180.1 hypothetical protein PtA15_12A166 [Puccinia triticina]WAQ90182.1 hypothetical protein PtA15_12A168 [Puccinia triticina]